MQWINHNGLAECSRINCGDQNEFQLTAIPTRVQDMWWIRCTDHASKWT